LHPSDIKGVEDLHKIPFTKKTNLRDNYPYGMFTKPMDQIRRIHASSGTTGKPTVVGYSRNDLDVFDEVVARSLACAGARPGMKLHNAYGYGYGLFTGGLGMHGGATKLGMAVIPVSGGAEVIEGFWNAGMELGISKIDIKTTEAQAYGNIAIETGTVNLYDAEGTQIDEAKYLVQWEKEGERWKIIKDIWNSNKQ